METTPEHDGVAIKTSFPLVKESATLGGLEAATRTTIIDMDWCLLAEAQVVQRLVFQAISCSFTRTVYAQVPSLRRRVEERLNGN